MKGIVTLNNKIDENYRNHVFINISIYFGILKNIH